MPTVIVNWDRALARVRKYPDATIRTAISQVLRSDPHLTRYIAASGGENNVLDTLMLISKEAIRQSSADTKYFLEKLKKHNAFASQLTDSLVRLV